MGGKKALAISTRSLEKGDCRVGVEGKLIPGRRSKGEDKDEAGGGNGYRSS